MPAPQPPSRLTPSGPSSAPVFLALRRMRTPLVLVISVYAVSVGGLMLLPGVDAEGNPYRMDAFDAFYFMSYTATTIGFGEIPYPLTAPQRTWVIIAIYASVIAWAYAFGTILSLLQERGFREALRLRRFERQVARLREPFLLIAGFGQAGETLARSLDAMDRRLVVIDIAAERIDALDLASFQSDIPGLVGDARSPYELRRAGLDHPKCAGVVALTSDDEANLAVTMTAALLRPDLPVVTRSMHSDMTARMEAFGNPLIVDPFNLFGDDLIVAIRSPNTHRLLQWVTSEPGTHLMPPFEVPRAGRWIIAGYGRFGSHLARDLVAHGIPVTVVDPNAEQGREDVQVIRGDGTDPDVLVAAGIGDAAAFAAASDNDTKNLSMLVFAARANPGLFRVARQNDPMNGPLFDALQLDSVLVPTRLVAHEVLERIGNPLLWRFVQQAGRHGDSWAVALLDRLTAAMGTGLDGVWHLHVDERQCPAVVRAVEEGRDVALGALLRDPEDREAGIDAVPLMVQRGDECHLAPDDALRLQVGDRLLLAGTAFARGTLETTVTVPSALTYTATGERTGNSWLWRTFVDRSQDLRR